MSQKEAPFFVGYLPVPKALRGFLGVVAAGMLGFFGVLGWAMGTSQDDPGPGAFQGGRQTVTGILETTPYPVVHILEGTDALPPGHTLMLAGGGKNGAMPQAEGLDGRLVVASGTLLKRGELDMLQLRGGRRGLAEEEGEGSSPEPEDLGRWRLAGEICDGKCLAGAMRPGRGLAHKACANLCLIGGVPPVFVSSQPIGGEEFLMITGPDGTELPEAAYDWTAQFISVEGRITRHGSLLVFALDPETIGLAR
ncbi:MAG: hypothetical protein AAF566_03115 [Pseudomonadota bacterium]